MNDPRGSQWRKWDLHIHSRYSLEKGAKLSIEEIFKEAIKNHIEVIAITDHSNVDGLDEIWKLWGNGEIEINGKNQKISDLINFLPAVELKSERGKRGVHFIAVFPKRIEGKKVNKKYLKEEFLGKINCSEGNILESGNGNYKKGLLSHSVSFKETAKKIRELGGVVIVHAGTKSNGIEQEIAHPRDNANDHEILNSLGPEKEKLMKDYIDICEVPNRNQNNKTEATFYFNKFGKPTILSSDSHENYKGDKFTWIKADPTFEGLKQILYESEPGERVWIGSILPDQKNSYQVIKKIKFSNTDDFPKEVVFNQNLCSIIGSRSSGKSALLNYIAHAIDPDLVEKELDIGGAGEGGEEYSWDKIKQSGMRYEIEWANKLSNKKKPNKIVYIPQNYLFKESKKPEKIKEKIKPVLFKKYPEFKRKYEESVFSLKEGNEKIKNLVEEWFKLRSDIDSIEVKLKELGDEESIRKERKKIESTIEQYKKKYSLDDKKIKKYKELNIKITELNNSIKDIQEGVNLIKFILGEEIKFRNLFFKIEPDEDSLPSKLRDKILEVLESGKKDLLVKISNVAKKHYGDLSMKLEDEKKELEEIKTVNKKLFEKYKKNQGLKVLAIKLGKFNQDLKQISELKTQKQLKEQSIANKQNGIKAVINNRIKVLEVLKNYLNNFDQGKEDIKFSVEYGLKKEKLETVSQRVNLRDRTNFVINNELKIKNVRNDPAKLLKGIYSGDQKINKGCDKKQVTIELLTLTENILFVGEMEGDRIGGFKETTMTPGKRALFLLKLILAESDDKWPLLIDQPEDDLDSKSIAFEIVPFLKRKKRERQIIMVSHNANLVIGADSEQIIVANRNGSDSPNENGKTFNYLSGSIENTKEEDKNIKDTLKRQGIKEHACLILDGGKKAFEQRGNKYNLTKI